MQGTDAPFAHITCNTVSTHEAQYEQHISRAGAAVSVLCQYAKMYCAYPEKQMRTSACGQRQKAAAKKDHFQQASQSVEEVTETLTSSDNLFSFYAVSDNCCSTYVLLYDRSMIIMSEFIV